MIYYCVKTSEFLSDILDRASRDAEYFCLMDVPLAKAEAIIAKFSQRYNLEQTPRQRNYRLQQKPVVDLVVLLNHNLFKVEKVRLCLLCTVPKELRGTPQNCSELLAKAYALSKDQFEEFTSVFDRRNRLVYRSAIYLSSDKTSEDPKKEKKSVAVYELVQLPFTLEQRKKKEIDKTIGWTWRIHPKYMQLKKDSLTKLCQRFQGIKDTAQQDRYVLAELQTMWRLVGFRGVREDVFKYNKSISGIYLKNFNRKFKMDFMIPSYERKQKHVVQDFAEMLKYQQELRNKLKSV